MIDMEGDPRSDRRPRRAIIFLLLLCGAAGFGLFFWLRGGTVPGTAIIVLDLRRPVAQREPEGIRRLLAAGDPDLVSIRRCIRAAIRDPRVRGALVKCGSALDLATAEEILSLLETFRRAGKPVIAEAWSAGGPAYLAACAADEIHIAPSADLGLTGISVQALLPEEAFPGSGIEIDLVGAFESPIGHPAPSPDSPGDGAPSSSAGLDDVADSLFAWLVEKIASARSLSPGQVRSAIDEAPISSARAVEAGLADRTAFPDGAAAVLEARCGTRVQPIGVREYLAATGEAGGPRIALVNIRGFISGRPCRTPPLLGEMVSAEDVTEAIAEARRDGAIRGIILRIDSPGGALPAVEGIWREVETTRTVKPVVASLGSMATAGAYYAACAADRVIADASTITGAFQVVRCKVVVSALLEARGIRRDEAVRGRRAGMFGIGRRFSDEERMALRRSTGEEYRRLIDRVAVGRKKPFEEVERLARGRIWTGRQAAANGLVDEVGGLDAAVTAVCALARLTGGEDAVLVPFPSRTSVLDVVSGRRPASDVLAGLPAAYAENLDPAWIEAALGAFGLDGREALAVLPAVLLVR